MFAGLSIVVATCYFGFRFLILGMTVDGIYLFVSAGVFALFLATFKHCNKLFTM